MNFISVGGKRFDVGGNLTINNGSPNIYSEEETRIGVYSNKPLYRKLYKGTTPVINNETYTESISFPTDYDIVMAHLWFKDMDGNIIQLNFKELNYLITPANVLYFIGQSYFKNKLFLCVIEYTKKSDTELSSSGPLNNITIDEYDQDGWHIRKWSDGYVEMVLNVAYLISESEWSQFGSVYMTPSGSLPRFNYPISLAKRYKEDLSIHTDEYMIGLFSGENVGNKTGVYNFMRGVAPTISIQVYLTFNVTGRWKETESTIASTPMIIPEFNHNINGVASDAAIMNFETYDPS